MSSRYRSKFKKRLRRSVWKFPRSGERIELAGLRVKIRRFTKHERDSFQALFLLTGVKKPPPPPPPPAHFSFIMVQLGLDVGARLGAVSLVKSFTPYNEHHFRHLLQQQEQQQAKKIVLIWRAGQQPAGWKGSRFGGCCFSDSL